MIKKDPASRGTEKSGVVKRDGATLWFITLASVGNWDCAFNAVV